MSNQQYTRIQFGALILAALFLLYTLFHNSRRTDQTFELVNHTYIVIAAIDNLGTSIVDLESSVRGYAISGNPVFLADHESRQNILHRKVLALQELTSDNIVQGKHIEQLSKLVQGKIKFQETVLDSFRYSQSSALQLISQLQGKKYSDEIKQLLARMKSVEQDLLKERVLANKRSNTNRLIGSLIAIAIGFAGITFALVRVRRSNRLRHLAEKRAQENQMRYKKMVENSAVVMYHARLSGEIIYISNKSAQITGYAPREVIGQDIAFLVVDEWKERVIEFYRKQVQDRVYETLFTFPVRTKTGEIRWVEQSMVLLEENDQPSGFQSIVKDITARQEAESALKAAEDEMKARQEEYQFRMQAILDNMPMVVYIKDLEGRYVMVNRHFRESFGLSDDQILGKTNIEIFSRENLTDMLSINDEQVTTTLQPVEIEDVIVTTEGKRNMLVTKFPLFDQNKKIFAVCGVDKDITDMVRYRQQLIDARVRAEKAEQLQEEFLANMSHEIRTPMNGIIGMTNLLDESPLSNDQKEFVQLIKYSSNTLLALINDILDLSKIKAGRMTVEHISFSVEEVVKEVVSTFKLKAAENEVELNVTLGEGLPAFVKGDQHKLVQVLNNLVGNAVKFTPKGVVSIAIETESSGDEQVILQFSVADTGIGIAPENLGFIFESFRQSGNDMMRRFGGTGLGLAITKRLVELQGGSILVESTLGKGSMFSFRIAYQQASGKTAKANANDIAAQDRSRLAGKKILLVEDNLINQKVTQLLLDKARISVTIANNGKEAVELLEKNTDFDLIIMDLQMPEMNGIQATAFIRNKLKLNIPIIAMTASALRNERERCLEVGMNEYLTKPFVPGVLFSRLNSLLLSDDSALQLDADTSQNRQPANSMYSLAFLEEMEDEEYMAETLVLFLDNVPKQLEQLKAFVLHEQWSDVYAAAHKLKGSFGFLHMQSMLQLAAEINDAAANRTDLAAIPSKVTELLHNMELVRPMLEADLRKLQATAR